MQKGRLALQQGDLTGATGWYQKAAGLNAPFAPGEYSPAALADELRRAGVPADRLVAARPATSEMPALRPDDFAADRDASLPAALAGPAGGLNSSAFRNSVLDRPQDVAAAPYDSVPAAVASRGAAAAAGHVRGQPGNA